MARTTCAGRSSGHLAHDPHSLSEVIGAKVARLTYDGWSDGYLIHDPQKSVHLENSKCTLFLREHVWLKRKISNFYKLLKKS